MIALATRSKVASLVRLLGSDQDGEALAACRALSRILAANGSDLHSLAAEIEAQPYAVSSTSAPPASRKPWATVARWVHDHSDDRLSAREREFVADLTTYLRRGREPSEKQAEWLQKIYGRLVEAAA